MFRHVRPAALVPLLGLLMLAAPTSQSKEESAMIEDGKLVSFTYALTVDGEVIESNEDRDPLVYTQGDNQILAALEDELAGLRAGDKKSVQLTAEQGYGEVREDAYQEVPLDLIPEDARQVGAVLQSPDFSGPIRVTEIKEEAAILDFNHPLAGKALQFDVTVLSVDEAPTTPVIPAE